MIAFISSYLNVVVTPFNVLNGIGSLKISQFHGFNYNWKSLNLIKLKYE